MTGAKGICPEMSGFWGGEECWREEALHESRWRHLGEMRRSWSRIHPIGRLPPRGNPRRTQLAGLGGGSTTGETPRKKIVEAIEYTRTKILANWRTQHTCWFNSSTEHACGLGSRQKWMCSTCSQDMSGKRDSQGWRELSKGRV